MELRFAQKSLLGRESSLPVCPVALIPAGRREMGGYEVMSKWRLPYRTLLPQ